MVEEHNIRLVMLYETSKELSCHPFGRSALDEMFMLSGLALLISTLSSIDPRSLLSAVRQLWDCGVVMSQHNYLGQYASTGPHHPHLVGTSPQLTKELSRIAEVVRYDWAS